jgi:outer membrane protein assembly factor BamB
MLGMLKRSLIWSSAVLFLGLMTSGAMEPGLDGESRHDWPQWQGPHRDSISPETGLLTKWPAGGPPLVWKTENLGLGYSTPVVAGGKIYGMGRRGNEEGIWALEETTGKELWFVVLGSAPGPKDIGYNDGPRSSVAVDGERLYALTCNGDLGCVDAASQKIVWQTNFKKNLGGKMMSMWGFSESPLVDGDKLIATPGGDQNTVVAFDKNSGSVLWRSNISGGGGAGYGSPVVMTVGGKKMYVTWLGKCLVGVDADSGRECWRYA